MKFVKALLALVLVLAAVIVLGGFLLSPKFSVARSVSIAAPPEKVYALVVDPRRWKDWTVWNQRDPQMQMSYGGPPNGAGASWSWQSKTEGDGRMTFTAAAAPTRIDYELFFPDFGTTSTGDVSLIPEAGGTRVTWRINGDMGGNPVMRWFALFADTMIGKDFAGGLQGLKALAEKP